MAARSNPVASRPHAPIARPSAGAPVRRTGRGQSLAEFALTVPMLLLMVLFGLDFGRVFLGWVALNSAARQAANYAAMNPAAWTLPFDTDIQDEYERLVQTEASSINCTLESPISDPSFPEGKGVGAPAVVELDCQFHLITPFIAIVLGNSIPVSASSAFPVRAGLIEDVALETASPSPQPTASGSATPTATPAPTASPDPGATVDPSATATPTPIPSPTPSPTPATCTVVSLLDIQTRRAQEEWSDAGFTGAVVFVPLVPPHYRIAWQSLTVGTSTSCSSGITVRSGAP